MIHLSTVQKMELVKVLNRRIQFDVEDNRFGECKKRGLECDISGKCETTMQVDQLDFLVNDILELLERKQ